MNLSWNEIRARAAKFAVDWKAAVYEKGETHSFYNDFFDVFGIQRRSVARFEEHVKKLDDSSGYIDLFWPGVLLVEQKSAGRDLTKAYNQAGEYFDALPERDRPRYILVSDFQTFELYDLDERESAAFTLADLHQHVERFGFFLGRQKRTFKDQDPVNIQASELMGRLHDELKEAGYTGHDLELFLVRTVFCLFADDTGIFEPRDIFLEFLETRTRPDGLDLGPLLSQLFQVLNAPDAQRPATLDEDLTRFPYINGSLFRDPILIPSFTGSMRKALLDACQFDWTAISPAIFGALFQSVMQPEERRAEGAHYTTEQNILKVIEPLFLDDLRAEFKRLKERKDSRRRTELQRFQQKLGSLAFLDPACGCGNFLIIAYRELRLLEIDVLKELRTYWEDAGTGVLDVSLLSTVNVDQFYGIEKNEFPTRIAETALWMMDHIMNIRLSLEFGLAFARIPLEASPRIVHADALEVDWNNILPSADCSYVLGNPPFVGAKLQTRSQRAQVRRIASLGGSSGTLDYVAAWFLKAGDYATGETRIGFVATNSITQGEQVGQLWPLLFERANLELAFAHRTFAWGSDARGKAHVHVIIIGLDRQRHQRSEKRLFSYSDVNGQPEESRHTALSPYLIDASSLRDPHLAVRNASRPLNRLNRLIIGSKPIDNGHYIFKAQERAEFLAEEPGAAPFMRPYVGAWEFINRQERWILALHNASPDTLGALPRVRELVAAVREFRLASTSKPTQELAATPTLYHVNVLPAEPFLVVPEVSSERREYVPIGWLKPPAIPSNLVRVMEHATLTDFALLTSAMHMTWLRCVGGRLESRYRYSIGLVYNTFPVPSEAANLSSLEPLAQAVLDAREAHPHTTLADLYDPDLMPPNLRKAHQSLDKAVDYLYRPSGFKFERERLEHLFVLYERMTAPLTAKSKRKTRSR